VHEQDGGPGGVAALAVVSEVNLAVVQPDLHRETY
jgi:hypothetical protein